jgi:hypothetical protein
MSATETEQAGLQTAVRRDCKRTVAESAGGPVTRVFPPPTLQS